MPAYGLGHFDQSPRCSSAALTFAEDLRRSSWKPVPLRCPQGSTRNPPNSSKNFALGDVSSGSSLRDPTNSSEELIQASYYGDPALAVHHEFKPQVPAGRSKKCGVQEGHPIPLGRPSRMFHLPIYTKNEKPSKYRWNSRTVWSSRCQPMALGTMKNI